MKIISGYAPRRSAMAAAATASILVLTGCEKAEPATPSTAAGASAPVAGNPLAADCTTAVGSFRDLVKDMILSAADEDKSGARKALTDYAVAARGKAAKVTDAGLRAAVEQHAAAAEQLSKAKDPTDLEEPAFEAATGAIEKLCEDALTPTVSPGTATVRVGAAGSDCDLPVAFDLLPLWKPKAVDLAELGELADLYRNGPFDAACEVDGKPAGEIGNLRVYVAKGSATGTPREHLEAFVAADFVEARKAGNVEVKKTVYSELTIGGQPAAEVTYEPYNKVMEHQSKYSAFALTTPRGVVVVKLSPFGADEYANVLPAYDLVKRTLTVNG